MTEIQQKFYRNIEWVVYMKNTLLDKNIYHTQKYELNKNKYGLFMKINAPFLPIETTFTCGLAGLGILGNASSLGELMFGLPLSLIGGAGLGFYLQGKIMKDVLNLNENENDFKNDFKSKINNKYDVKLLNEGLKKFVYFKDDKIVGFIKFSKNITPPVEGYYFNCNFNMKIEVQITGVILNRNRYLKTQIDIYDSDEYIAHMKNIFKI